MKQKIWYVKYAWVLFVLVGVSGLLPGLQLIIAPLSGEMYLRNFGYPVPEVIFTSETGLTFLAFLLQWTGIMVFGANCLTILIATTAFRRAQRWAWYVFWYWPFVFGAHFFMYTSGFRNMQLIWLLLTVGALLLTYPAFFRRRDLVAQVIPAQSR